MNSARVKLSSTMAFRSIAKEDSSSYYIDIFRKAAKRVVVMVRIYKAMQLKAAEKNIFMFYENDESKLYRKFLNSWSGHWRGKQDKKGKLVAKVEQPKVYFAKAKKFVGGHYEEDGEGLLTAVKRMEERRKSQSMASWAAMSTV